MRKAFEEMTPDEVAEAQRQWNQNAAASKASADTDKVFYPGRKIGSGADQPSVKDPDGLLSNEDDSSAELGPDSAGEHYIEML